MKTKIFQLQQVFIFLYEKRIPHAHELQIRIRCIRPGVHGKPCDFGTVYCTGLGAKGLMCFTSFFHPKRVRKITKCVRKITRCVRNIVSRSNLVTRASSHFAETQLTIREIPVLGALSLISRGSPAGHIQLPDRCLHTQPGLDKASNCDI